MSDFEEKYMAQYRRTLSLEDLLKHKVREIERLKEAEARAFKTYEDLLVEELEKRGREHREEVEKVRQQKYAEKLEMINEKAAMETQIETLKDEVAYERELRSLLENGGVVAPAPQERDAEKDTYIKKLEARIKKLEPRNKELEGMLIDVKRILTTQFNANEHARFLGYEHEGDGDDDKQKELESSKVARGSDVTNGDDYDEEHSEEPLLPPFAHDDGSDIGKEEESTKKIAAKRKATEHETAPPQKKIASSIHDLSLSLVVPPNDADVPGMEGDGGPEETFAEKLRREFPVGSSKGTIKANFESVKKFHYINKHPATGSLYLGSGMTIMCHNKSCRFKIGHKPKGGRKKCKKLKEYGDMAVTDNPKNVPNYVHDCHVENPKCQSEVSCLTRRIHEM